MIIVANAINIGSIDPTVAWCNIIATRIAMADVYSLLSTRGEVLNLLGHRAIDAIVRSLLGPGGAAMIPAFSPGPHPILGIIGGRREMLLFQYHGPRPPEEATVFPEGALLVPWSVEFSVRTCEPEVLLRPSTHVGRP